MTTATAKLTVKPAPDCRFDIVSLGEVMLRLDPGEGRRCGRRADGGTASDDEDQGSGEDRDTSEGSHVTSVSRVATRSGAARKERITFALGRFFVDPTRGVAEHEPTWRICSCAMVEGGSDDDTTNVPR